ncbi:MAG: class I SAM-dependent methyltransferase [Chloroflexota bacterium]
MADLDIREYNRKAWDREVETGNPWTVPVSSEVTAAARRGEWSIVLTPTIPVPRSWFGELSGRQVLCLASGGGQQGPVLAAAGAQVTVFDNSPRQLACDRMVAERDGLALRLEEGDMRDLSRFANDTFDLIFHPVSNLFIPNVRPVWAEAFRVLKPGGALLAGFLNPVHYLFDLDVMDQENRLDVRYTIPYSDLESLDEARRRQYMEEGAPLEFGHTLDDQIGGQLQAGFLLVGFFEDRAPEQLIGRYIPSFIATRAIKP